MRLIACVFLLSSILLLGSEPAGADVDCIRRSVESPANLCPSDDEGVCTLKVSCAVGETVTGGGCSAPGTWLKGLAIFSSAPKDNGWKCTWSGNDDVGKIRATVICCD